MSTYFKKFERTCGKLDETQLGQPIKILLRPNFLYLILDPHSLTWCNHSQNDSMTATLSLFLAILFLASLTSVACRFHPLSPPLAPRPPHRYTLRAGAFETPLLSSADEVLQNYEQAKSLVDIQASSAAASAAGSASGSASASAAPQPIRAPAPATSLAPLRLLMFLFYCSLGTIGPYLPVFYQSLSLPGIWIGILGAITPLMTLLASPIWGWWIDKHCGSSKSKSVVLLYAYLGSVCGRLAMPGLCEGGAESSGRKVALVGLIAATSFLFAPVKPLLDAMVMRRLDQRSTTTNNNNNNKNNSGGVNAYGKMRLWGQIGFGVGSSLVGLCMRRFNEGMQGYELLSMGMGGKNSYLFAFLAHAAVSVPTGVAIINCRVSDGDGDGDGDNNINVDDDENNDEEEDPQQDQNNNKNGVDIAAGLRLMTSQPPILLFFSLIFVIGMASGIIEVSGASLCDRKEECECNDD